MKIINPIIFILSIAAAVCSLPVHAQSATTDSPRFEIKIQTEGAGAPSYTVTNLTSTIVTACVIRISSSADSKDRSLVVWDALLQNVAPIKPNASISQFLAHRVGGPVPDRVEVLAAVWSGGETFGESRWLDRILENRKVRAASYDEAIALLRDGLDHKWTRQRYLQALNDKPDSGALDGIRATLTANPNFDEHPEELNGLMQKMLDTFAEKSDQLRKAKPTPSLHCRKRSLWRVDS